LDTIMNTTVVFATSLALSAIALSGSTAVAQGAANSLSAQRERDQLPCASTQAVIDSARAEAMSVLFSNTPVLTELRQEQGVPAASTLGVSVVRDGSVCQRLASSFGHAVSPGTRVTVLRLGPIFYARDPDQHHATGFFADSTLKVLVRLGPPMDK
jgi:hypothetical protein